MKSGDMENQWDIIIRPQSRWFNIDLKGIWHYRDLVKLFVRRDFVAQYKQTILGPLWIVIQPLLTTLMFSLIFSHIAKISTAGIPPVLFYMAAFVPWTYFADCIHKTSTTFTGNASIFGKVYFPRLVTPISVVISNLFKFLIQMGVVGMLFLFYAWKGTSAAPGPFLLFTPLLILLLAGMGMAIGLVVSSLTTRFRDLSFLVGFAVQLLMYASSVVITFSTLDPEWQEILKWNPMVWIIEGFRYAVLGVGTWSWMGIAYSAACMVIVMFISLGLFGKVEKTFMDTV